MPQRQGDVDSDGVRIHYVEEGPADGPVVLLVHGFPELSYSWRHQLPALGNAGYRAVAIDVRGYGASSAPSEIGDYRMLRHVADNVALAGALGAERVVVIGHDWGAPIAWTSALLRPDLFDAACLLSVPYLSPASPRPTATLRKMFGPDNDFYMIYFQEPGRVETELGTDLRGALKGLYYAASADGAASAGAAIALIPKGERFVDRLPRIDGELSFLPDSDLDVYVEAFEKTGLSGGLNRYRNLDRDWEDLAAWRDQPLKVPTLFIGGELDGPTIWGAGAIASSSTTVPDLRGSHILPATGHWIQQERPEEVNQLLLDFLREVRPLGAVRPVAD